MPFTGTKAFSISQVDDDNWKLNRKMVYYDSLHINSVVEVPRGFTCDGSSIPRLVWPIVGHPLLGANAPMGFLHDYLYRERLFDRKTCDLIFLEGHENLDTPLWKRQIFYQSVRMFGWFPYNYERRTT